MLKDRALQVTSFFCFLLLVTVVFTSYEVRAASSDGAGEWADGVVSFAQGSDIDGNPIALERSDPQEAVGEAEGTEIPVSYVTLGIGGTLTLRFENALEMGGIVVEGGNNDDFPIETGMAEASENGVDYYPLGNLVAGNGGFTVPNEISCVRFIRLTDTTEIPSNDFGKLVDGVDIDGVRLVGQPCEVPVVPEFGVMQMILAGIGGIGGYFLLLKKRYISL